MIIKPGDKLTANFQESIHTILKKVMSFDYLCLHYFYPAIYRRTSSWYSRLE